ncbi:hypothetical protein P8A22_04620 [Streptomyces laculatispora]|uniref:Uncharacterized protein n=1 Tax=Streptomyces laculatispora TaxID=887464 RepID=A0ABY9HZ87_9ACTN|nr:hypothetical protein [Streptomyces laculatispora]WLQ39374.1 hypothetical protein P8A22_04620 [Streptomyces laculatispora]
MGTRKRLVLALLAFDAGRWWAADWARERLRLTIGVVDECWCCAYQALLCRFEENRPRHPMDEINALAMEEIEWAFFVARHRADGVWRDTSLR